jgi:hypothetical protein
MNEVVRVIKPTISSSRRIPRNKDDFVCESDFLNLSPSIESVNLLRLIRERNVPILQRESLEVC